MGRLRNPRITNSIVFHDTSSIGGATDDVYAPMPGDAYSDDGDRGDVYVFMPDYLSSDVGVVGDADGISDVNDGDENDARRERHGPNPLYIKRARGHRIDAIQQGTLFDLPMFTPSTALYPDPHSSSLSSDRHTRSRGR